MESDGDMEALQRPMSKGLDLKKDLQLASGRAEVTTDGLDSIAKTKTENRMTKKRRVIRDS